MTDPTPTRTNQVGGADGRALPFWQAGLVFVVLSVLYAAVSFQQYNRMDSFTFDLGFFEAVVRDYARGDLPELQVTDTTTATLHFSPILALLAPLVMVVPSPLTLLGAQAIAVAAGVVPLMRAAGRGWIAWVVALSYGLSSGLAALIGFDFHEVALGVPFMALSMAAMLRSDHRAAVLWALPLILVKEDLALSVAALGAVVLLRGSRRLGLFAMVLGTGVFALLHWWVLPAINGDASGFAEQYAPGGPAELLHVLLDGWRSKLWTVLFLLIPTGLVALRAPMLLVVTLPTFGWRFVSDRTTYWEPWYHYDAILVPVAVAAMIEGVRRLHPPFRNVALGAAVIGTLLLVPKQALSQAWDVDFWREPARTKAVDRVLDKIPDDSTVAASDDLGARLGLRTELYLIGDTIAPDGPPLPPSEFDGVDWVALDLRSYYPATPAWRGFVQLVESEDFEVVAEADGVVVAKRRGAAREE